MIVPEIITKVLPLVEILGLVIIAFFLLLEYYEKGLSLLLAILSTELLIVFLLKITLILGLYSALDFFLPIVAPALILPSVLILLFWKRDILYQYIVKFQSIKYDLVVVFIVLVVAYIAIQVLVVPPNNADTMAYHLARLEIFEQENSLYPANNYSILHQLVFPVNYDLQMMWFVGQETDIGVAIFSWFSFIQILLTTYMFSKDLFNHTVAKWTTLTTTGLSSLILNASNTKNDIQAAAIGLLCLYLLYKTFNEQNNKNFIPWLLLALAFGLGVKTTFAAFAVPFFLVAFYVLRKKALLKTALKKALKIFPLLLLLVPTYVYAQNIIYWSHPAGPEVLTSSATNPDGIPGAIANTIRYAFEMIDLVFPLQWADEIPFLPNQIASVPEKLTNIVNGTVNSVLGKPTLGQKIPSKGYFQLGYSLSEDSAWFGYSGFLLFLPALIKGLIWPRAKLLRYIALIQLTVFGLIAYNVAWSPWKSRYFLLFFVPLTPLVADLIKSIIKTTYFRVAVIVILCSSIFVLGLNTRKPLIKTPYNPSWLRSFQNRKAYMLTTIGEPLTKSIPWLQKHVPRESKILMLHPPIRSHLYPYFIQGKDYDITFVSSSAKTSKEYSNYLKDGYFHPSQIKGTYDYYILAFDDGFDPPTRVPESCCKLLKEIEENESIFRVYKLKDI